jgi:hypothetical protein
MMNTPPAYQQSPTLSLAVLGTLALAMGDPLASRPVYAERRAPSAGAGVPRGKGKARQAGKRARKARASQRGKKK